MREMDAFVGRFARITSLEGVDRAGCAVVRVDVDGGAHYWRVRDMVIAGSSLPAGVAAAVPRWCGMDERSVTYGSIDEGSEIVLGRHSPWDGATNWSAEMERWVGRRARVTSLAGRDAQGCAGVRVDLDGGQFFWRLRDVGF
jgi:hypothetical protein